MSQYVKNTKAKWYTQLMKRFEDLMARLGMPDPAIDELKEFMLSVAREQYMAGNRSGIRWAHEQNGTSIAR